jgi:hypothetical protein
MLKLTCQVLFLFLILVARSFSQDYGPQPYNGNRAMGGPEMPLQIFGRKISFFIKKYFFYKKCFKNVVGSEQDHFVMENVLQAWKLLGCLQVNFIV